MRTGRHSPAAATEEPTAAVSMDTPAVWQVCTPTASAAVISAAEAWRKKCGVSSRSSCFPSTRSEMGRMLRTQVVCKHWMVATWKAPSAEKEASKRQRDS